MNDDQNKLLKEVKEVLEIVNSKVKLIESTQRLASHQITFIKDQQSVMNEKLDDQSKILEEHTDKIDALMSETLDMHQQVGAIWDRVSSESDETAKQIKEIKLHVGLPVN